MRTKAAALLLAVVAYLPPLLTGGSAMNADTKLGLKLNPGRLLSDAHLAWDGRQFGGWVPHQTIAYLWPSGPFYWVAERIGLPAWVAQRLWVSTLLFAAGCGVLWLLRRLGFGIAAATAAAFVYMLSPYVLAYLARTSAMLLPWAGLPWIVGFTARAVKDRGWRWPAAVALVVATVGAVNATALAMIIPGPVLWLIVAIWSGQATWKIAAATAARIAALSTLVSLWWISAVAVQQRYGADVLGYSETVDAVSLTTTSTETMRGLGYWLFYVRDPYSMTTSAARPYLMSGRLILMGFALLVTALAGLAVSRGVHRRFAGLLIVAGVVLGVGVHPLDDPAPLPSLLSGSWLSLAIRSSSRAVPLLLLGVALGVALFVDVVRWPRPASRTVVAAIVAIVAVAHLPALCDGGVVDPTLSHDEAPAAWREALGALGDSTGRVLQVPGTEFGAFDWGYTADQPLHSLTGKPVITRDLLPLGSPAAMDLLYAFDNRIQSGTLEAAAVAPVARFLGADRIWNANDIDSDRYRTPRAGATSAVLADSELTRVGLFGTTDAAPTRFIDERDIAERDIAERDMAERDVDGATGAGEPVARAEIYAVDDARIARTALDTVVLAGSGDGVVDAAAAGLLDGREALLYAAQLPGQLPAPVSQVILTDSNRVRAEQWRSSQDTVGFTESGDGRSDLLVEDPADARLPVFTAAGSADLTTATLDRGVTVRASAYGEPFAYRPESRPAMAVDGDPETAWVVGDRSDPLGEYLELTGAGRTLQLLQPRGTANRMITEIVVDDTAGRRPVDLDERSLVAPGQLVEIAPGTVRVTISAIDTLPSGVDTGPSAVGFAELLPTGADETVHLPQFPPAIDERTPVSVVLTRLRHDPLDRWRSDPEPVLRRQFDLPIEAAVTTRVTVRLNQRAADEVLAGLLGGPAAVASGRMAGGAAWRGAAAVDGDLDTAWTTPFGAALDSTLTLQLAAETSELTLHQPTDARHSPITAIELTDRQGSFVAELPWDETSGIAPIPLPRPLGAGQVTLRIAAIEPRWTGERRYGEVIQLPSAITEIGGISVDAAPPEIAPGCRDDLLRINDAPVGVDISAEVIAGLVQGRAITLAPCALAAGAPSPTALPAGRNSVSSAPGRSTGIDIDRVVFAAAKPPPAAAAPPAVTMTGSGASRSLRVEACPEGCWVVFGEGYAESWQATAKDHSFGAPVMIAGGFNGWWLDPTAGPVTISVRWPAQRWIDLGIALSAAAVIACVVLLLRRRPVPSIAAPVTAAGADETLSVRAAIGAGATLLAFSILLIGWPAPLWALLPAAAVILTRRLRPLWWTVVALAAVHAARLVIARRNELPEPDAAWPGHFEFLHRPGLLIVAILLTCTVFEPRARSDRRAKQAAPE